MSAHQHQCLRCGRVLRSHKSIADKYGPRCKALYQKRLRDAVAAGCKQRQADKARELIEDGGIVAIRGRRIFRAVSSDGARIYKTAAQACTCDAGIHGRHVCFHRIAAASLAA